MPFRKIKNFDEGTGIIPSVGPDDFYSYFVEGREYLVSTRKLNSIEQLTSCGWSLDEAVEKSIEEDNSIFRVISRKEKEKTGVATDVRANSRLLKQLYDKFQDESEHQAYDVYPE